MKKITLFFVALLISSMCFSQLTVTNLWEFSVKKENVTAVADDIKNGIAISPDGTKLYLSARAVDANQVAVYEPSTGIRTGYLPALTGFASNYGGDVATDKNGAIYASNVIISASALKIAKWDSPTATPTLFISTTAHPGVNANRIGYGFDVRVNSAGDGFIIMHQNGTSKFLIWTITANAPTSQDPTIITAPGTALTDAYARISIVDDNNFWIDGNATRPYLATITKSGPEINATPTAISLSMLGYRTDVSIGVGGMTEFLLAGKRYGVIAANNHGTGLPEGHMSRLQELQATGVTVEGAVIETLPTAGLGKTSDASHFVESVVHVDGLDAYIYTLGGFNGITAHKVTATPPPPPSKTFTVTVPNGTEKVYVVGSFTDKVWDITNPYELTATGNLNEFSGTFDCGESVEYKYFCEKDWDFGEAVYGEGANPPTARGNRSYNAIDVVPIWLNVNKITLNVSFEGDIAPAELFVKGSFDTWTLGIPMVKAGDTFSLTLGGNPVDKLPANTEYKYYTTEMGMNPLGQPENWEAEADGGNKGNRWSIAPVMNDVVQQFESRSSGVFKVGTTAGADFVSLKAATTAVNAATITGNVVLEITSDLEEANMGLIFSSDFSLTIRPDADADRTITFNTVGDTNAGPSGGLCIGVGTSIAWVDMIPTKNITIDGYAVGGTTRRLKIATAATHHSGNMPILLLDDCSNINIKNCIIHHVGSSTGATAYGIYLRVNTSKATKKMPSNVTIENNIITSTKSTSSQAIGIYSNGAPSAQATGIVIKDNEINASTRGIFMSYVDGIEITGNEFRINQLGSGLLSSGIMGFNGVSGDVTVDGNKFIEMKTANVAAGESGIRAIIASGGATTWNITNNFFTGFDMTAATGVTMLQAIRCGDNSNIMHNTFYLNSLTNKPTYTENPGSTTSAYCAINVAGGTNDIKNNIFVSDEDAVYNYAIRGTAPATTDNNVYDFKAGTTMASANNVYPVYADYVASGVDANSTITTVNFVDAATGDLKLKESSIKDGNLAVPLLATVGTDMFGTVRGANTYAGAHESEVPFSMATVLFTQDGKKVTVNIATKGVEIRYTIDGSTPTAASDLYVDVINLPNGTSTVKVLATKEQFLDTFAQETFNVTNVGLHNAEMNFKVIHTMTGIEVQLNDEANIELYNMSGMLLDKTKTNGTYSRNLDNGIYIIRINGKATKFIK